MGKLGEASTQSFSGALPLKLPGLNA